MKHPDRNSLYYGDCLDVLASWPEECVDLCYLDPPFNSNANYNILFGASQVAGSRAQIQAFSDTWTWDESAVDRVRRLERASAYPKRQACMKGLHLLLGRTGMLAYVSYMAERLTEIHRVLRPTGTVYLHCDPTASHYLKLVMDAIFNGNFRNEIIWCYRGGGVPRKDFARKHDIILRYTKSNRYTFNPQYVPYSESSRKLVESRGGVSVDNLPRPIERGAHMPDWWPDINSLQTWSPERTGYPTQKPLALLKRIIESSSNQGDLVLDPFCGCGTTVLAADALNRDWAGIDLSPFALDLIAARLGEGRNVPTQGMPADLASARRLASENPFEFEKWSITRIEGLMPNKKQRSDGGIDGRGSLAIRLEDYESDLVLAQVKGGKPSISQLREFLHVVDSERAALGVFITVDPVPKSWNAEASRAGSVRFGANKYPRIQCWSISDYYADRLPVLPPLADPFTGKDMARQRVLDMNNADSRHG